MQSISPNKLVKLLLATAVAAAFANTASAQSTVNVEGLVDAYVGSMRNAGDAAKTTRANSGGMSTSYFGFRGTEDLGGGLKANFALTSFLRADTGEFGRFTGDTLFSRDANVGLSGNFGSVTLGRLLAPNFLPTILFNPFGDSFTFSPLVLHFNVGLFNGSGWGRSQANDTGWSNQVRYTTPNFGGLTANMHYQFGEAAGNSGKNNVGGNLLYFKGPLSLTAFYQRVEVNNPLDVPSGIVSSVAGRNASHQKMWFVGAAYDFTVAKLFGTYDETSHNVDFGDKTYSLGASVPVGTTGKVLAAWARTERSGSGFAERKRNTVSLGYDHTLSKRTDLYTVVMNDRITNLATGTSFGAGIRHRF
jgi:predicted porin